MDINIFKDVKENKYNVKDTIIFYNTKLLCLKNTKIIKKN